MSHVSSYISVIPCKLWNYCMELSLDDMAITVHKSIEGESFHLKMAIIRRVNNSKTIVKINDLYSSDINDSVFISLSGHHHGHHHYCLHCIPASNFFLILWAMLVIQLVVIINAWYLICINFFNSPGLPFILWYIKYTLTVTHCCLAFCPITTTSAWLYGACIVYWDQHRV